MVSSRRWKDSFIPGNAWFNPTMASDEEDQDTYVAQLKAVFKSCDTNGIGYLDRRELRDLCHKLQLEDQAEALIQQLMEPGSRARVKSISYML